MKNSIKGLIISIMLILVLGSVSVCVFAEDVMSNYGLFKPEGDQLILSEHLSKDTSDSGLNRASFPSRYDGRRLSYSSSVKVKNQNPTGMCWAFAASTASERSWLQEQVNNGGTPSYIQLSPMHLGYFVYHKEPDLLGGNTGDSNVIVSSDTFKSLGGNNQMAILTMSQGVGLATETLVPFNSNTSYVNPLYCYRNSLTLENGVFLYSDEAVKEAIIKYGAVAADYYSNSYYRADDNKSYYCNLDTSSNHAITIVGWDDDYSADNFAGSGAGVPPINGAWIIQNSWGVSAGESGYYYISYADSTLCDPCYYDVQPADTYDYIYQLDGNCAAFKIALKTNEKFVNFYTAGGSASEILEAVGMMNMDSSDDTMYYTVDIYKNAKASADIVDSKKVASFDVSTNGMGYYTFELPAGKEVTLSKGTNFAVSITFKGSAGNSGSSWIGSEQSSKNSYVSYNASNPAGRSYWVTTSSYWYDLGAQMNGCARIKALTRDASSAELTAFSTDNSITLEVNGTKTAASTLTPGTFTDKTVIWKSSDTSIATVNESGTITGLKAGKTTISAAPRRNLALIKTITVYVREETPVLDSTYGVDLYQGAIYIKNYRSGYLQITVDGTTTSVPVKTNSRGAYISIDESWYGKTITIIRTNSSAQCNSGELKVEVEERNLTPKDILFEGPGAVRTAGADRYATSLGLAEDLYTLHDKKNFDCIVVACGSNFPDALSGGYLAYVKDAPLITVDDAHQSDVYNYINARLNSGGKIYILGGEGAVSTSFERRLRSITSDVTRLAGPSRYDTNIEILREAGVDKEELLICSGTGFADALSASAVKRPILLVGATLTDAQKDYLRGLGTTEMHKGYVIGGAGAVADSTAKQVKSAMSGKIDLERVAGASRYETSIKVAERFFTGSGVDTIVLTYGQNFPDGLSGGPVAMELDAPLILAETNVMGPAKAYVKGKNITYILAIGGSALISDKAVLSLLN